MRVSLRPAAGVACTLLAALASAPAARAADLWTDTGQSLTPVTYWQGVAFDSASRSFFFAGPGKGLWRTDANLSRRAGRTYIQILSYPVDPATGNVGTAWRLEIQRTKSSTLYETEGLTAAEALGGTLHRQIQPQTPFYTRLVHFVSAM